MNTSPPLPKLRDDLSVPDNLGKAWHFLSGEHRAFHLLDSDASIPFFGSCYFLPVRLDSTGQNCAIGILISKADAMMIAQAMFGLPVEQLNLADLEDACQEVCNVLSGSSLSNFSHQMQLSFGLPMAVDPGRFDAIVRSSELDCAYLGHHKERAAYVLFYNPAILN